jgi:2-dehydropantoate 2-reductase
MSDRVVIVGSGAMACLFGARLARSADVTLLAGWPEAVETIRRRGIEVDLDGRSTRHQVAVAVDPGEIPEAAAALVLVKCWQTERAAGQIGRFLAESGVALTLQNGLGNLEALRAELGEERAAMGVTTYAARLLAPGKVRPAGEGVIQVGDHSRLGPLIDAFTDAGLVVERVADVRGLAWGKLAVNAGINPLSALLRVPNGALAEQADARRLLSAAVLEVAEIAQGSGVELPYADPVEATLEVARRTSRNRSSMLQDIERGAPTEVDAINGAVVAHAAANGQGAPVNETLWRLVRAAAAGGEAR